MIDITPIINAFLVLLGVVITFGIKKYVVPYMVAKIGVENWNQLLDFIKTMVYSKEGTIVGENKGAERFNEVLQKAVAKAESLNITINIEELTDVINGVVASTINKAKVEVSPKVEVNENILVTEEVDETASK